MGNISTAQLIIKSSNVGMAQIGVRSEKVKMYETLWSWGFGSASDVELPGVANGILPFPEQWRGVVPANIAIGQGLAITPLQLINAMAAVVNGGKSSFMPLPIYIITRPLCPPSASFWINLHSTLSFSKTPKKPVKNSNQVLASCWPTMNPGTMRKASGMLVAPVRRRSSPVMTYTAAAVSCRSWSRLEMDVTVRF